MELADYDRGLPLARLGMKLEQLLDRPVQLVAARDAEASPTHLSEALRDGRVLVDREERWPRLKRRERTLRRQAETAEAAAQEDAWRIFDELAG